MDRYQFGNFALLQMRPDGFEFRTVREALTNFHCRIGFCLHTFSDQFAICQRCNRLPFHDTTLLKPLRSVLSHNVLFFGDKLFDRGE